VQVLEAFAAGGRLIPIAFSNYQPPNLTDLPIGKHKGEARFAPTNFNMRHSRILIWQLALQLAGLPKENLF
jgi:hypothetical protein